MTVDLNFNNLNSDISYNELGNDDDSSFHDRSNSLNIPNSPISSGISPNMWLRLRFRLVRLCRKLMVAGTMPVRL